MAQHALERRPRDDRPPRMTYEEFLRWIPDGKQAEWVDGEVTILTVNERHDALSLLMITLLSTYVRMFDLGRVLHAPFQMRLRFRPSGREPDLLFIRKENLHRIERLWVEGGADFVVEFLSDQTARTDLIDKLREYAQAGVGEYLMVDARDDRDGFIFNRLDANGHYQLVTPDANGRYHAETVSGFWFDPAWFRQDPLPSPERLMKRVAGQAYVDWVVSHNGE